MKSEPSSLRRLVGRGWQILLLWVAVFIPIGYLIWHFNPPTYEAVSILQVQPFTPQLFGLATSDFGEMKGVAPHPPDPDAD